MIPSKYNGRSHPRRGKFEDARKDGAVWLERTGSIAEAQQELVDDLTGCITESLAKKFRPFRRRSGMQLTALAQLPICSRTERGAARGSFPLA